MRDWREPWAILRSRPVLNGVVEKWPADLVCLTDNNLVSLALPTGRTGLRKFYRHDFAFFHSPQSGLYRVMPITLKRVGASEAGAALAAEVSTATAEAFMSDCQLSPRVDSGPLPGMRAFAKRFAPSRPFV